MVVRSLLGVKPWSWGRPGSGSLHVALWLCNFVPMIQPHLGFPKRTEPLPRQPFRDRSSFKGESGEVSCMWHPILLVMSVPACA